MNRKKGLVLPLSVAAILVLSVALADAPPSPAAPTKMAVPTATKGAHEPTSIDVIPEHWDEIGHSPEEPSRTQSLGGLRLVSYGPKDKRTEHAHFTAWGKFDYDSPQSRGVKKFTTEVVGVRIDCARSMYSEFRHLWFDDKGNIIEDDWAASKFQSIPVNFGSLGVLKPALAVAESAMGDSCGRDAD